MARTITQRPEVGITARIIQHQALHLPQLQMEHCAIVVVKRGIKTITTERGVLTIRAGEAVALAAGQSCDIHNQTDASGRYEAGWIALDPAILQRFQPGERSRPVLQAQHLSRCAAGLLPAFELAVSAICNPESVPAGIARHRISELLLWLDLAGYYFSAPVEKRSTAARVRQLLSSAPEQHWTSPRLAQQLAMSEATLRRKLAAEATSWSALLMDVRMTCALTLLQSTDHPVAAVSLLCGYESASRFAARFRLRFGFHPSAIRRQQTRTDLI